MSINAGFQQSVVAPNTYYPGSLYGVAGIIQGQGQAFLAAADLTVGYWAWGINNTNTITNVKGSNTQLAGLIYRSQANVWSWNSINQGWSYTLSQGSQVLTMRNGAFVVEATTTNGGGVFVVGDVVYINDTTGATVTATSTPGVGYTATEFVVIAIGISNTFGVDLVAISNTYTF